MERRDSVSEIYRSLSRTVYDGDYETTTTRERERERGHRERDGESIQKPYGYLCRRPSVYSMKRALFHYMDSSVNYLAV